MSLPRLLARHALGVAVILGVPGCAPEAPPTPPVIEIEREYALVVTTDGRAGFTVKLGSTILGTTGPAGAAQFLVRQKAGSSATLTVAPPEGAPLEPAAPAPTLKFPDKPEIFTVHQTFKEKAAPLPGLVAPGAPGDKEPGGGKSKPTSVAAAGSTTDIPLEDLGSGSAKPPPIEPLEPVEPLEPGEPGAGAPLEASPDTAASGKSGERNVLIQTTPPGATVFIDGQKEGTTTGAGFAKLLKTGPYTLTFEHEGKKTTKLLKVVLGDGNQIAKFKLEAKDTAGGPKSVPSLLKKANSGGKLTDDEIAYLESVPASNGQYADANIALGAYYTKSKKPAAAAKALEKAVGTGSGQYDPTVLLALAKAYGYGKQYGKAGEYFKKTEQYKDKWPTSERPTRFADLYEAAAKTFEYQFKSTNKAAHLDQSIKYYQRLEDVFKATQNKDQAAEVKAKIAALKEEKAKAQ